MSDLLEPGQIFAGRYRIEKFLARGGFGAVYVAEQMETELRVAIKVLWPHVLGSEEAVEKFKLEARIAGRVGSEHIVKVFDAGFDDTTKMPFLVMELLAGSELEKIVESSGPIPAAEVVAYISQVASALDKAHGYVDRDGARRPIIHRDLKPENLFLTHRETGEPVVKILDFGIAKVLSDSTKVSQEVRGTPLYMAFEQASAGRVSPQTDIWALGLVTFYLLTARCYWKTANSPEASITQLFGEVLMLPLDPASQRAREIGAPVIPGAEFDAWFARCVDRDPAQRFATAGDAARALAAALGTSIRSGAAPIVEPFGGSAPQPVTPLTIRSGSVPARSEVGMTTASASALGKTQAPVPSSNRTVAIATIAALGSAAVAFAIATLSNHQGGVNTGALPPAVMAPTAAATPEATTPPPPASDSVVERHIVDTAPSTSASSAPPGREGPPPVRQGPPSRRSVRGLVTNPSSTAPPEQHIYDDR
jgi:serine/threonine-protein kinase